MAKLMRTSSELHVKMLSEERLSGKNSSLIAADDDDDHELQQQSSCLLFFSFFIQSKNKREK